MTEPDLFDGLGAGRKPARGGQPAGGDSSGARPAPAHADLAGDRGADAPLAARMRPASLADFHGQEQLLGPGRAFSSMLEGGELSSVILWGPPGCGKTTLARLLAERSDATFVSISAVTAGVARIREIAKEATVRRHSTGRRTILFCDEIHRFNKAQQDAFLPIVEDGTVILIGATTENPSFEVIRPLLSRAPVMVLKPLDPEDLAEIMRGALADAERGLPGVTADADAIAFLAEAADGDARRALGVLEGGARLARGGPVTLAVAREALQHRYAAYDKSGEEHFNLISALHKSIRGSDPDAALYWLARMLQAGEDPMYVSRRLVRMASEDIGLADPGALAVTIAARDAYHFLGEPEGELALAEAAAYLASAPKSNRVYGAWKRAQAAAAETPAAPVPLHIRNAPTALMTDLGYGAGYRYDHDEPEGVADQSYLPELLVGRVFYEPVTRGYEEEVSRRLQAWADAKSAARAHKEGLAQDSGPG